MPAREKTLLSWGLLAACLLVYANTFAAGYTYDDKSIVRDNPRLRSPAGIEEIFSSSYFGSPRGTAYRPVLLLTFAAQWWVHGQSGFAFHFVNVLLHAGCTLLWLRILWRLRIEPAAAAVAALLFAVLPVHTEAVAGLVGRGETLAAFLVLAALWLALSLLDGATTPWRRVLGLTAFLLLYLAALLTKESAVVLPGLLFLALALRADGGILRRGREALARGSVYYLGSAGILAGLFWMRAAVLGGALKSGEIGIFELENPLASLPWQSRAANAAVLLLRGIGRTVLPLSLSADESAWSLPKLAASSPVALAASALCLALTAAAVLRARFRPALSFAVAFFFVAALPTANLLFPTGTVFAERLLYLPSAGLCLGGGLALAGARRASAKAARVATAAFAAAVFLLSARTIVRNTAWADDEALFAANVRTSPQSAKSHYNLGWVRAEAARFEEALAAYTRAVEIYPKYWDAWSGKGRCEMELGRLEQAAASYAQAIRVNPSHENAHYGAGMVEERRGDDAAAARVYRAGLRRRPDSVPLAFRLATVRSRIAGADAGPDWRRALILAPGSIASRIGYGRWLFGRGRLAEAAVQAREAIRRSPRATDAWRLSAEIAATRGAGLAELVGRERVFRLTRQAEDLSLLLAVASRHPELAARFESVRPGLTRLAPNAFRALEKASAN